MPLKISSETASNPNAKAKQLKINQRVFKPFLFVHQVDGIDKRPNSNENCNDHR